MSRRILIACGGTGGHVFPGVAAAQALRAAGAETAIILSGRAVEGDRPAGWDGAVITIPCPPPRWRSPHGAAKSVINLARAFAKARREIKAFAPDALLAMGSYTSVPPALAARWLGVPLILHEANAIPGAAVSFLSRFARLVCLAFNDCAKKLPKNTKTTLTGLPLRAATCGQPAGNFADAARFTILVMGGSQGAESINHAIAGAARILDAGQWPAAAKPLRIIHLAGAKNEAAVRAQYDGLKNTAIEVIGFSNEMGALYAASDLCVSRAGAASCFELCANGLPSLLIPLPKLARDHQLYNARELERLRCAETLLQSAATPEALAARLSALATSPDKLRAMSDAARRAAQAAPAEKLAAAILAEL